ncbi:MAG: DMT family transporter [Desulfobacterales bacterium]|nr:DMT family transporter [Desulfobacterales bacterium]MDD4073833.1 DMT family transporter [Desulfobacterales bacterium]MDD4393745.1 DMT family transporter [Desulfobacterales bacterium]
MKPKTGNFIQLNVAVLIWGGTSMFAKGIPLPVGHITCIRSIVAAVMLLLFLIAGRTPIKLKCAGHYGIMAVLGILLGLHWLTFFKALKISTAAVAILSLHTYPVFTALVEPFVFGEKLKKIDVVTALVMFAGVLSMTPEISLSNRTTQAILLGVVSGLFFMVRNLITRKYVQAYSSCQIMFWEILVTGAMLVPLLFLSGKVVYSSRTVGLLVLLGTIFTAFSQTLFSASLRNLSAKTVSICATVLPFYGAFFGYLIYGETVTPRTVTGGIVILTCIVFEIIKSVREKEHRTK